MLTQLPAKMNSTAIDSRIFRNLFGTEDARQIFSDTSFVSQMIAVEAALSRAEAKAGVIPKKAAVAITEGWKIDGIK